MSKTEQDDWDDWDDDDTPRVNISYLGLHKGIDDKLEALAKKHGGESTGSGYFFGGDQRDVEFKFGEDSDVGAFRMEADALLHKEGIHPDGDPDEPGVVKHHHVPWDEGGKERLRDALQKMGAVTDTLIWKIQVSLGLICKHCGSEIEDMDGICGGDRCEDKDNGVCPDCQGVWNKEHECDE